ncbi:MAG: EAL and HDOD domain-containing protein, partial [Acidimicrobiales bacterium]
PRPAAGRGAQPAQGDMMTARVLFGSSLGIGLDRLVGNRLAFCNATRGVLVGDVPVLLPPERTVIEILETVEPDDAVIAGCRRLQGEGYTLALDDFVWFEGAERFLELASIVKLDVQSGGVDALGEAIERCRGYDVKLLAEKVETEEELERCAALGFSYFQGYLLWRPEIFESRSPRPGHLARMRLAMRLADPDSGIDEIERVVRSDPALGYRVLRAASVGADGGLRRPLRSLRDALVLLGWRRLRSWVTLMLLADEEPGTQERMTAVLVRARMTELLAERCAPEVKDSAFTAGLLSGMDVLAGTPRSTLMADLPVDDVVRDAVLAGTGPLGELIADVADYQLGLLGSAARANLPVGTLQAQYLSALSWAIDVTAALDGASCAGDGGQAVVGSATVPVAEPLDAVGVVAGSAAPAGGEAVAATRG